jgi:hypothetical protein
LASPEEKVRKGWILTEYQKNIEKNNTTRKRVINIHTHEKEAGAFFGILVAP